MPIEIADGSGSGRSATVNTEMQLLVSAVTEPIDQHVNEVSGKVWSLPISAVDPTGAADYIFYLKNTGAKDIHITDVRLSQTGSTAAQYEIQAVTGTAASGTTLVPVSRTIDSSAAPVATIEYGVNITGLTTAGTLFYLEATAASALYHLRTTSHIIIPKSKAVAILANDAAAITTGIVSIFEAE